MKGKTVLHVVSFCHILHIAVCIFYHESSRLLATQMEPAQKSDFGFSKSDFGFSLGYKDDEFSTLVVGAPRHNSIGMVYTCLVQGMLNQENIVCNEVHINVDSMVNYTRERSPNQKFYLGSTIAATSDYFLTCAPLLTTSVKTNLGEKVTDAFGTCFVYDDVAYRSQLNLERFIKRKGIKSLSLFQGGIGWSTLTDKHNNLTLIGKTSLSGDIVYMSLANQTGYSRSAINEMRNSKAKNWLKRQAKLNTNMGYGLAAGNFFSTSTVYAFSMTTDSMSGIIAFLEFDPKSKTLSILMNNDKPQLITNEKFGSIFGFVMDATDVNLDGYSELLVGAPAFYDDEKFEYGAVHIYIGGSSDLINHKSKMRTIIGTKREARFGSTIATQDIDGDSIPEIFISAPYEDSGLGAVYILSGYEVNRTLLGYAMFRQLQVSDLKLTQIIKAEGQRNFGFSLQIIRDVDDNSCKELAVGSPGTDTVLFYRCLPAINVTITTEIIGAQLVREQDNNFTVAVCANVGYPSVSEVAAILTVISTIEGIDASIPVPEFQISLADMESSYCENIIVLLNNNDPADFIKFTARVNLNYSEIQNSKRFNSSWVTLSPYSKTQKSMHISRHCKDEDCKSKLSMNITWSGNTDYLLGSSETETVTVRVRNDGRNAYEACMWVTVSGAQVDRIGCSKDDVAYKCYLPKPLRMNTENALNIVLNMSQPTSHDEKLTIAVQLHEICHKPDIIEQELVVNYILDPSQIYIEGSTQDRNVTDTEIMERKNPTINDGHEYLIINRGSVLWKDVIVVITMEKKAFIQSYSGSSTGTDNCNKEDKGDSITFTCDLNLMPNSTKKLIAAMEIAKDKISNNLINGKLNTTSSVSLHLKSFYEVKSNKSITIISFKQEFSFNNNKSLIILVATIVAIIILTLVIIILHRVNFFKRKQKRKLEVLRESVRRKSIKRNESTADNDSAKVSDGVECIELEVIEDSPFEENLTPARCNDDVVLIEAKAQVHC